MFFTKNELVELDDNSNYLILDTTMIGHEVFYQIQQVNAEGNNVFGDKTVICASNINGNLFIENVKADKLSRLGEIFVS